MCRYHIGKVLGAGSFGIVREATEKVYKQEICLQDHPKDSQAGTVHAPIPAQASDRGGCDATAGRFSGFSAFTGKFGRERGGGSYLIINSFSSELRTIDM